MAVGSMGGWELCMLELGLKLMSRAGIRMDVRSMGG
jgi:hypothetical protein